MNQKAQGLVRRGARPAGPAVLELSLVRALVALLTEQSVSRAAESLGQSQPQMSATLRRMRELLGDPILVRGSRSMMPTEHALSLLEPARRILADAQTLTVPPARFNPVTTRRTIRLAIPDFLSASLLAAILGAIRAGAPESSLVVSGVRSDAEGADLLESGRADVVIESSVIRSALLRYTPLFDDGILAVAAHGHRALRDGLTLDEYLDLPHVAAAPASGTRPGLIDRLLRERGHARRVVAWVPYLNTLPQLLARSDLVFTTTAHMIRHFVLQKELRAFAPPIRFPRVRFYLMWHDRMHRAGDHRWLRGLILEAASAELAAQQRSRGEPERRRS